MDEEKNRRLPHIAKVVRELSAYPGSSQRKKIKLFPFIILILIGSLWSVLAWAGSLESIQITLAPEVQTVLEQVAPAQKARLEKDIQVGNAFIKQHLDGSAYDFDPGYVEWSEHTGSLLTMSGEELERTSLGWSSYKLNGSLGTRFWTVCPQVRANILEVNGMNITLSYQMMVIGTELAQFKGVDYAVSDNDKGRHYHVRLDIGQDGKIKAIIMDEDTLGRLYITSRRNLVQFIRNPRKGIAETQAMVEAKVARYRRFIDILDSAAAEVCSNTFRHDIQ